MFLISILIGMLKAFVFFSGVASIFSFLLRSPKYFTVSIVTLIFFVINLVAIQEYKDGLQRKEVEQEEEKIHSNLLLLPEGRYILDHIVSTDSAKVRFVLQLPGVAKRKAEVIAYEKFPIYWNEWQVESAVPGDTLIIFDVWNTDSTYSRLVQKMDVTQVGWGYLSFEWLEQPGWRNRYKVNN